MVDELLKAARLRRVLCNIGKGAETTPRRSGEPGGSKA
jgi:hypothetical protein